MKPEFIRTLSFRSRIVAAHDPDQPEWDVALWRSAENICQLGDDSRCDDSEGLYYGSADDPLTWFCPRHCYEMHSGPNRGYTLVDEPSGDRGDAPPPAPPRPRTDGSDVEALAAEALDAFWEVVARHFPRATTGDLSPERTLAMEQATEDAIGEWVTNNVLPRTSHADAE